jgi:hypothetical protein
MRHPSPFRSVALAACCACVFVLFTAASVQAQAVTGQVVSGEDGQPIAGAFVILFDADGRRQTAVLTDRDGRYLLRSAAPGRYRLRVEQIGFESVDSPLLDLAATTVAYPFVVPIRAVALPVITVEADSRCRRRDDGAAVHALWEEIRKALDVAAFTDRAGAVRYTLLQQTRELDAARMHVLHEERTRRIINHRLPYLAGADADALVADGFMRLDGDTIVLLGPDAHVLLSTDFSDAYCFRVVAGAVPGEVGLGFEPARRRRGTTAIQGVLWVERATSQLTRLEYSYVDLPSAIARYEAGGELHFRRLPNGSWIVDRWAIRSPVVEMDAYTRATHLLGTREEGGTVLGARQGDELLYEAGGSGTIAGRVHDHAWDGPRAGTVVGLSGTPWAAVTDSLGEYRIERVPPGRYAITVTSDWMRELFTPARIDTVTIPEDAPVQRHLETESFARAMLHRCSGTPAGSPRLMFGVVYGVVVDPETGVPLPGVTVRAEWGRNYIDVDTDAAGRYAVCWLPRSRDVPAHLRIVSRPHRTARIPVMLAEPLLRHDFY